MKSNIKEIRLKNNYTQEKLAREIDISLRQMQNIEKNKTIPSVEIAIKIKRVFNIMDIEELFNIDE
jgi:Predicted transcriptional regulators